MAATGFRAACHRHTCDWCIHSSIDVKVESWLSSGCNVHDQDPQSGSLKHGSWLEEGVKGLNGSTPQVGVLRETRQHAANYSVRIFAMIGVVLKLSCENNTDACLVTKKVDVLSNMSNMLSPGCVNVLTHREHGQLSKALDVLGYSVRGGSATMQACLA